MLVKARNSRALQALIVVGIIMILVAIFAVKGARAHAGARSKIEKVNSSRSSVDRSFTDLMATKTKGKVKQ